MTSHIPKEDQMGAVVRSISMSLEDEPPFGHPVFVLTHHAREPLAKQGGTTFNFVTDGIEAALEQARTAAGPPARSSGPGADRGPEVQGHRLPGRYPPFLPRRELKPRAAALAPAVTPQVRAS
jgi:hypothetical protein